MKTAFVVCSRYKSSRVPGKAFIKYAGKPHIEHLIERLIKTEIPIYLAVPDKDLLRYAYLMDKYPKRVFVASGHDDDPLARMNGVAKANGLDTVIRVTHDKIFVDDGMVYQCLGAYRKENCEYLYSSDFVPGSGFEIISADALARASEKFKKVEHVSYAIRAVTKKVFKAEMTEPACRPRLLVDYPEDVQLMTLLFSQLPVNCTQSQVLEFIHDNPWMMNVNRTPKLTLYTCAYNAGKWIEQCMKTVAIQTFKDFEYIIIDDCSTDDTAMKIAKFASENKNVQWIRLPKNVGLSSSCNVALARARGEYIMRLDADDYFSDCESVEVAMNTMEACKDFDVLYSACYEGVRRSKIQDPEMRHVGGALFRTAALNHMKFTDGLRGLEGLDLWTRAQDVLNAGYNHNPIFVYRQTPGSMSRTNLKERKKIRDYISRADLDKELDQINRFLDGPQV